LRHRRRLNAATSGWRPRLKRRSEHPVGDGVRVRAMLFELLGLQHH
jgi:hypothetical protein